MIKSIFRHVIQWAMSERPELSIVKPVREAVQTLESPGRNNRLSINLYPAIGGKIIEFWHYDSKDERHTKMYVIPETEDLHEQLTKIISLEMIRL